MKRTLTEIVYECDCCGMFDSYSWYDDEPGDPEGMPPGWFELKGDGKTKVRYRPGWDAEVQELVPPPIHFCPECYEEYFSDAGRIWWDGATLGQMNRMKQRERYFDDFEGSLPFKCDPVEGGYFVCALPSELESDVEWDVEAEVEGDAVFKRRYNAQNHTFTFWTHNPRLFSVKDILGDEFEEVRRKYDFVEEDEEEEEPEWGDEG